MSKAASRDNPEKHLKTPKKTPTTDARSMRRARTPSLKALENLSTSGDDEIEDDNLHGNRNRRQSIAVDEDNAGKSTRRKSTRRVTPNKQYTKDFLTGTNRRSAEKRKEVEIEVILTDSDEDTVDSDFESGATASTNRPNGNDLQMLQDNDVAGKNMFGFVTPKKRNGMALAALNTPKTPKTPRTPKTPKSHGKSRENAKTPNTKRRKTLDSTVATAPKTPSHVRSRLKNQIAKIVEALSDSDFSADDSDFEPVDGESSEESASDSVSSEAASEADDEIKTPRKTRQPIIVPVLPKTPSAARVRQSARAKKSAEYVPETDGYFQAHASSKILTSDHTLDRLKNPRLPADRLFSLLAEMQLSSEHESAMNAMMEEYRSYFSKWLYILNEGYNLLLYGLGSKRQLLQSFHRQILAQETVVVINGFFPSLTLKDILDSITNDILDAGTSPANPHEAADIIEEEFNLIPETHLFLIIHNLDGVMLRNTRAQDILSRLAKVRNIHLLASVDHINTPLLWDHTKLSNFNFSWWDCTTMLPYTDETAYENSLMVQNSGELALSSMRSVFSSLTTNSRGIYLLIVKHQLTNKSNPNYQGISFKDLYSKCREAFLVSSDLALRAQLTEFLDHKMVKSKRTLDGSEQLLIPIDSSLLQQFLDEQQDKR